MNLGDLAFRLILILIPGILATLLYRRLIVKKNWESIDIGLNTLLFGLFSYLLLQLVYSILGQGELAIWQRLQDSQTVPYLEIFWASIASIFATIFAALVVNRQIINRVATWLKITTKYGDYNLFYSFFSRNDVLEIHVKDIKNNTIYTGYLKYYSEDNDIREIVLEEVDLYDYNTAQHMNSLAYVYLNWAKSANLVIEVPKKVEYGKTEESTTTTTTTTEED